MNIIILASGAGSRFEAVGVSVPKPIIKLFDRYFFELATESILHAIPKDISVKLFFTVQKSHSTNFSIDKLILDCYSFAVVEVLENLTDGPAESAFLCLKRVSDDEPLVVVDCDLMFELNSEDLKKFLLDTKTSGALATFKSQSEKYSYLKYDKNNKLINVMEKVVCSSDAVAGIYFFRSKSIYLNLYKNLRSDIHQEKFISMMYSKLLQNGQEINHIAINRHLSFGTPEELESAKLNKWIK
jgi:dTDP-glucose pyrophosphorylase